MVNGQYEAVLGPPPPLPNAKIVEELSDRELLTRFVARRDELAETAFETLVRRHGPMVLRVCQQVSGDRHIAEDAFQATFLILARKAGSISQPELLSHWLHGVALRTAREARMRHDRRRRRDFERAERLNAEPIDETARPDLSLICREAFEILHEEVAQLPDRYRGPVILCDLEGLTHRQAATLLRCPVGTIGVRLIRAREQLRSRLTRRGLAPTAGLLGALVDTETLLAHVPSSLVDSTVQAAIGFATGEAVANGLISTTVSSLTHAGLKAMALARAKLLIGIGLAIGTALVAGWLGSHQQTRVLVVSGQEEPQREENEPAPSHSRTPRSTEPRSPVRPEPDSFEPHEAQPRDFSPALQNTSAAILASYASQRLRESIEAARMMATDFLLAGREHARTILPDSRRDRLKQGRRELQVNARPDRDHQARGEDLFAKEWTSKDPASPSGDGLGPIYNETSCIACHALGAPGGAGPASKNVVLVTSVSNGCGPPSGLDAIFPSLGGARSAVLHRYSTDPDYGSWRRRFFESEGKDQVKSPSRTREESIASRIRTVKDQAARDRRQSARFSPTQTIKGVTIDLTERNTPPLFGTGQIDEIPYAAIVATAASQPPEVRGRIARTQDGRIGRFGWKAQIPSLHEFVRVACANELGLEVPGHSQPVSPVAPTRKPRGLDLTEEDCDALVTYVRALPAPVVVDPYGPRGTDNMRHGRRLFGEIGCVDCHRPTLGQVRGIYSDLLLHDLGQSLSDPGTTYGIGRPDSPQGPTAREWRTPPLWGYRDSGPYLHDGRAENLEEVVAFHEGQAKASAKHFFGLSSSERGQVEAFLKSLVAPGSVGSQGAVLAEELDAQTEKSERPSPEALVRQRREQTVAREAEQLRAAKRARVRLPIAHALEKMGKNAAALDSYREIAREAPSTVEGQLATARLNELTTKIVSP